MVVPHSLHLTSLLLPTKGKHTLYFLFILISLFSCRSQTIETIHVITLDEPGNVLDIHFIDDLNGIAVGGDIWEHGFTGVTADGGISWSFDSLTNKVITAVDEYNGTIVCGGLDGKVFYKQGEDWDFQRTKDWRFIKDIIAMDNDQSMSAGGQAYRFGFVNRISGPTYLDSLWSQDIELQSILRVDDQTLLAAGYGIILRSVNSGLEWSITDGQGDFFTDLCFIDERVGFVLGHNGLILKTTDAGISWTTSHNLGDFAQSSRLRDMAYIGDTELWAVGKEGKILITKDTGDSWEEFRLDTDKDLLSINAQTDKILISGEDGYFISLDK